MNNQLISNYLSELRQGGENYYNIFEIIKDVEDFFNSLKTKPYSDISEELQFDMEIWYKLERIKNLIELQPEHIGAEEQSFLDHMKRLKEFFFEITIPVSDRIDLPFWYTRVLKRAGQPYVDDIKLSYGVEIEVF